MAIETTPLGFQKPDGDESVRNGDNVIAANADRAQTLLTDARARLAYVEAAKFSRSLDGGTPFSTYPPEGAVENPLELNDSAVVQAVTAGPETKAALDGAYAPAAGSTAYATSAALTAGDDAVRAEQARRAPRAHGAGRVSVGAARIAPGKDARYSAFPVQTKLADDRILMVWYEATDHATARDGIIRGSISADNGLTWGTAYTVLSMASTDVRDPAVSTSTDKQTVYLCYFKGSAALAAAGYFMRKSTDQGVTFGPEVRIDNQPYAAGCSPIVQLENGDLLAVWYGRTNLADAYDSVWSAISSNGGTTWSAPDLRVNGLAAGRDYQEPWAVVRGSTIVIMFRWGNADSIGKVVSTNSGASWGAPAAVFLGTGRPSTTFTSSGTLIAVYRDSPGSGHAVMRYSRDNGTTWSQAKLVERVDPAWMLYSCPLEVSPGVIMCSTAIEQSATSGVISIRYLLEGGAISPYGDVAPRDELRSVNRLAQLAVADSFDRPDSTTLGRSDNGHLWVAPGHITLTDGAMDHNASTGTHHIRTRVIAPDMEVEAELSWATSSGVYVVLRYQGDSDYLMAGIETSGANLRLYKVVAGTATQLGTAAISAPAGYFHRVKATAVGDNLRVYFEDDLLITATDAAFNTASWAGVRVGVDATACNHRARNFITRRRSGRAA